MTDIELQLFASSVRTFVNEQIQLSAAPLLARIAGLEARLSVQAEEKHHQPDIAAMVQSAVDAIPRPKDGKDAEPVNYAAIYARVLGEIERKFAEIPAPKDGANGTNGKDADPVDLRALADMVLAEIEVPEAKDGKDAPPIDYALIESKMTEEIRRQLAELPKAKDGEDGKDGANAEPVSSDYVGVMVRNAVDEAMKSIVQPKDGAPGKDAEPIHPDTVRLMVSEEVRKAVAEIPKAKDGADGRDALQIEPLPFIDETKSYPRGTYAHYKGGIIRANRSTDPITETPDAAGWDVIQNGIAYIGFEQLENIRDVELVLASTSGKSQSCIIHFPVPLQRGVFKAGSVYALADTVTQAGSQWICNEAGTKSVPGDGSKGWTLMVKRGADGKDFRPSETPADPGPVRLK